MMGLLFFISFSIELFISGLPSFYLFLLCDLNIILSSSQWYFFVRYQVSKGRS